MLVITANTLRQQLTNTEGMECECDLSSKMAHVNEKSQMFLFTFISNILLPFKKNIGHCSLIHGEKNCLLLCS